MPVDTYINIRKRLDPPADPVSNIDPTGKSREYVREENSYFSSFGSFHHLRTQGPVRAVIICLTHLIHAQAIEGNQSHILFPRLLAFYVC